jgi:hypothetical protein
MTDKLTPGTSRRNAVGGELSLASGCETCEPCAPVEIAASNKPGTLILIPQKVKNPVTHMTLKKKQFAWFRPAVAALAFAWAACQGRAQTANDLIVNQFDDGTVGGWAANYGSVPITLEFDPNEDRGPGASPGALKVTVNFDLCTYLGSNQRDWERTINPTVDLTKYTKLHFSVKVDPSSSHMSDWGAGALGNLRPHIRLASWGGDSNLGSDNGGVVFVPASNYGQWVDYAYNIDQTINNLATRQAMGVWGFDMWSGWGTCAAPIGQTNTVVFWLDNIWFEANTNTAPPPPPVLTLEKSGPSGVEIIMDDKSDQWQRNAIVTPAGNNYIWTGQGGYPVTYSCTITNFPDQVAHPGFEAHMYIVNGDTAGSGDANGGAPDYVSPDVFLFRVENITGGVRAQIQWKTNDANANSPNVPALVTAPSAIGTWSVTFSDATHGTMSGPGMSPTNFTLPDDAVLNNFTPASSFVQFGMFKNDGANDGHNNGANGTFSRAQITAPNFSIDDSFTGPTLSSSNAWRVTSASAVQHIPPGSQWLVDWTLPATAFNLESATKITGPWAPAVATRTYQGSGSMHALIPFSSANETYFRTVKRPFVKLQVLMPGETNAPNTLTGKTGTPIDQAVGLPFNITVNSVDQYWNVIPSSDTVTITSSDTLATLPTDAALFNGTRIFSVTLGTAGISTITATDVTDGTKTAGTGSINAQ